MDTFFQKRSSKYRTGTSKQKRQQQCHRRRRDLQLLCLGALFAVLTIFTIGQSLLAPSSSENQPQEQSGSNQLKKKRDTVAVAASRPRRLTSSNNSNNVNIVVAHPYVVAGEYKNSNNCEQDNEQAEESDFPSDLFTQEQRLHGAVLLHIVGMIYMFIALATVCDEFFVPTLDVIMEKFDISDDVAGATFMAAGGSAPELFAALVGVFVSHSNVGVGTIVGSASFNILFVVGMCTMLMKGSMLQLTWWPLFRDVTFYVIDLVLLVAFFKDNKVLWYECSLLLFMYIVYVLFMKYNASIEAFVKSKLCRKQKKIQPVLAHPIMVIAAIQSAATHGQSTPGSSHHRHHMAMFRGGNMLRVGIAQQLVHSMERDHRNACPAVLHEMRKHAAISTRPSPLSVLTVDEVDGYDASTTNSDSNDENNAAVLKTQEDKAKQQIPGTTTADETKDLEIIDEDESKPLDLSWPSDTKHRIIYVLMTPIIIPLWTTIPDVRKPALRKLFPLSFIVSVLWLGVFSYLNIWLATTIGDTFGIPDAVMGLTVLAAGTSIPDMLNSIIVARRGLGDMAVSSSVGSNIFDITIGMQTPWVVYFIVQAAKGHPVEYIDVKSAGMACDVGLLLVMILMLVIFIALFRWRINRKFGVIILLMYFIYTVIIVLIELGIINCILQNSCAM